MRKSIAVIQLLAAFETAGSFAEDSIATWMRSAIGRIRIAFEEKDQKNRKIRFMMLHQDEYEPACMKLDPNDVVPT